MPYKPYVGGGGPTDAQVESNNAHLHALLLVRCSHTRITIVEHPFLDDPTPTLKLVHTSGKILYVGYDRWGYCSEADEGAYLDQASLKEALDSCLAFDAQ